MPEPEYGKIGFEDGDTSIVIERKLDHRPENIWHALTDAQELRQWFMADAQIEGKAGGKVEMITGMSRFQWSGTVRFWEPYKLFEYEARIAPHDHLPGGENVLVRWELAPEPGGALVKVTHRRLSGHTALAFAPGVHAYLDRLEAQLGGLPLPYWMERYAAVKAGYAISSDRIEKTAELAVPVSRVWQALTDHNEFGSWFGVRLEGPLVQGQEARGQMTYPGYEHVRWEAVVQKMEPERFFSFSWHPYAVNPEADYSAETPTLVEFTLEEAPKGTLLRIVESGFSKLPTERRDKAFRMHEGGWSAQLVNIAQHLQQPR
jgi:uncharacterized protein YndB with AHSA1/START domain